MTEASPAIELQGLSAAALLQLLWLASPALPVGGYSYSEGLEPAIEAGLVHDEASTRVFLLDLARLALARSELPLIAAAHRLWTAREPGTESRIVALNDWVLQTRETAELRQQTLQMGRSLHDWLRQRAAGDERLAVLAVLEPAPSWPLVFALAAAQAMAPLRATLLAFAFGWGENIVQAAVKALPLGQSAGQRLLAALVQVLPECVEAACSLPDDERQSFVPMQAILSSMHETQYSRLFRS